jgi:Peptidase S46
MKASLFILFSLFFFSFLCVSRVRADEGMWTFNNFPSRTVGEKYGFTPNQAWLDHVRDASLRIAEGCSASFISPHGLVMTNYHCVVDCVNALSTAQQNLVNSGFVAHTAAEEKKCPEFELDQLTDIKDVTADVHGALAGKTGEASNAALRAERAKLEQSCGSDPKVRCDLVSLYHGGIYNLYQYRRFDDVRLVFSPEFDAAFFGGDPDNFNFPRFDFDLGLVRVYENGQPVSSPEYLHWSRDGSKENNLVFVSGNPGGTSRQLTVSELEFERDKDLPSIVPAISEYRGSLEQFVASGPEQAREASERLLFTENAFKVFNGRQQALMDPQFFNLKVKEEKKLRDAVVSHPELADQAKAWDNLARIQVERAKLYTPHTEMDSNRFFPGLLSNAISLLRIPVERAKPNAERLPEYTDQGLVEMKQELLSAAPVYKDVEELRLRLGFSMAQRNLGADDPFVRKMLGNESPAQLAHRLVSETKLDDVKVREELFNGGQSAIDSSKDPMVQFARLIDPDLRSVRKEWETKIDAPTREATQNIAKIRFAIYGTSIYPDATFTARLNFGTVKGFNDQRGRPVQPFTNFAGLYERANGAPPFALPKSWLSAKSKLNFSTPMNLCTTNDIIGGNSGSPLISQSGEVVGLVFDGNIFSIGGDYGYDPVSNRAVAVDSRALLEALRVVYGFDRIVNEIESAR